MRLSCSHSSALYERGEDEKTLALDASRVPQPMQMAERYVLRRSRIVIGRNFLRDADSATRLTICIGFATGDPHMDPFIRVC